MNPTAAGQREKESERGVEGKGEEKGGGAEESAVRSVISCLVLY